MNKSNIFKKTVVAIAIFSFAAAPAFAQPADFVSIDIAGLHGDNLITITEFENLVSQGMSDAVISIMEKSVESTWSDVNHAAVLRDIVNRALPIIGSLELTKGSNKLSSTALATKWVLTAGNAVFGSYVQEYMQLYITKHSRLNSDQAKMVASLLMSVELGAWQVYVMSAVTSRIDATYKGNDKTELRKLQSSLSNQSRAQLNEINASLEAINFYPTGNSINISGQSKTYYGTNVHFTINAKKIYDNRDSNRYQFSECLHYDNDPPNGIRCTSGTIY